MARRPALRLLVVPNRRQALERIVLHATNLRIPVVEVEGGTLTSVAGFDGHQGVGLVVRPRTWATLDEVFARAGDRGEPPYVLALDSLEDPQNVGTLLRSAEAVGAHGVLFPTHHQAPLSPAAVKASAGATEHLLLVPVDDLAGALATLHVRGVRIIGAEEGAPLTAREADLRGPIALVVGSEGQGLGPAVRRRTDLLVRIPMRGAIGSLNAAVAGSIVLFEILEQRAAAAPAPPAPVPAAPATDASPTGPQLAVEPGESPQSEPPATPPMPARRRRATADAAPAEPPPAPATPARRRRSTADAAPAEPPSKSVQRRRTIPAPLAPTTTDDLLSGDGADPAGTSESRDLA